jgi:hypothetical protein
LIPRIDLRALVFVAVALACVVGLASRVVVALGPPVALDPSQSSNFRYSYVIVIPIDS